MHRFWVTGFGDLSQYSMPGWFLFDTFPSSAWEISGFRLHCAHTSLRLPLSTGQTLIQYRWVNRSIWVLQEKHSGCSFTGRSKWDWSCKLATSWAATDSSNPPRLIDASRIQLNTSWEAGTIPSARYTNQSGSFSSKMCILGSLGRHHHRLKVWVAVTPVSKVTIQSSWTEAGSSQENKIFKKWSGTGCWGGFRSFTWSRPHTTWRRERTCTLNTCMKNQGRSEEKKPDPTCTHRKYRKERVLTGISIIKMFRLEERCLVTRTSSCSTSRWCR